MRDNTLGAPQQVVFGEHFGEHLVWKKSQRSNPSGNCVEVAKLSTGEVAVRHSRHTDGPVIVYTRAEIDAFLGGVKDGEFDYLIG